MLSRFTHIVCVIFALLAGTAAAQPLQLVMLERDDCPWCQAWHREIGPGYPGSAEGQRAPLRRIDLAKPWPEDLPRLGAYYTPTFVLVACGSETGRLAGYPGEHFFYPALAQLLSQQPEGASC